jgi:hypothetical protein
MQKDSIAIPPDEEKEINSVQEGVDPNLIFNSIRHINARGYCIDMYTPVAGEWPEGETQFIGRHHMQAIVNDNAMTVPMNFDIEAETLSEAFEKFSESAGKELRRQNDERIQREKDVKTKLVVPKGRPNIPKRKGKSR